MSSFHYAEGGPASLDLSKSRKALLGPYGAELVAWLHGRNTNQPLKDLHPNGQRLALELQWIDSQDNFTRIGHEVSGSMREYTFWRERGRRTHGHGRHPSLDHNSYLGLRVLEVGSGFGCNLFSLARIARRVVGVEPVATYREISPILAELEGLAPIELVEALAESLPFEDGSFDRVICYSSHQYMNINVAFPEMARVLAPRGQLQLVSGSFMQSTLVVLSDRSMGSIKHFGKFMANTLAYQWLGRRVVRPGQPGAMSAPIYPTVRWLRRAVERAGLQHRDDLLKQEGSDTLMFADKPGR
jgi:ubiquinone/menaquinone biosynthesis C-methylase UbiE